MINIICAVLFIVFLLGGYYLGGVVGMGAASLSFGFFVSSVIITGIILGVL